MTLPVAAPAQVDVSAQVQSLLGQIFNSPNWRGEVEKTIKKNVRLTAKVREQQAILDKIGTKFDLTTGAPKEGVLLTKEEEPVWKAFLELKLKPEDIKKMTEEHTKLKAKDDERQQEEQFADASEALGYKNVPALTRWLLREKLVLEFKDQRVEEEQEDGTKKKVLKRMPYVRAAGDDKAAPVPLEDYIEEQVPEFVDIFRTLPKAEGEADEGEESGETDVGDMSTDALIRRAALEAQGRVKGGKGGVKVPAMKSANSESGKSKDAKLLEKMEQDARSNPMYRI